MKVANEGPKDYNRPDINKQNSNRARHSRSSKWSICADILNSLALSLVIFLVCSELLTIVWSSTESSYYGVVGGNTESGPMPIVGDSDVPYTDRLITCMPRGCSFEAVPLIEALEHYSTANINTDGTFTGGYRTVHRAGLRQTKEAKTALSSTCAVISATLNGIIDSCKSLGYKKLSLDGLRILDGIESTTTTHIPNALPVLISPFSDNSPDARYMIPGDDGHVCVFRLSGKYMIPTEEFPIMLGINQTVKESKVQELLGFDHGRWKNGWFEDPNGMKWYADLISTDPATPFGALRRWFDTALNVEKKTFEGYHEWEHRRAEITWGFKSKVTYYISHFDGILIANGYRMGIYRSSARVTKIVESKYSIVTLIFNTSLLMVIWRWISAILAHYRSYKKGYTQWIYPTIGNLAYSPSFNTLPLAMLLRLPVLLTCFWTVGCYHTRSSQSALSDAWFVMYPAIAGFVILQFSILNWIGKITGRRISDALFGPVLLFYFAFHYFRVEIGASDLFGFDNRLDTVVAAEELDSFSLIDLCRYETALRIGSNVVAFVVIKIAVVACTFILSLLFSEKINERIPQGVASPPTKAEAILKLRASNMGGLGRTTMYYEATCMTGSNEKKYLLDACEVGRMKYVVFGGKFLITWDDWFIVTSLKPFQSFYKLWNHRIMVFRIKLREGILYIHDEPEMCRVDEPKLLDIAWWEISLHPIG